jgi:hypothetical protein
VRANFCDRAAVWTIGDTVEFFNLVLELKLTPEEKHNLVEFMRQLSGFFQCQEPTVMEIRWTAPFQVKHSTDGWRQRTFPLEAEDIHNVGQRGVEDHINGQPSEFSRGAAPWCRRIFAGLSSRHRP